MRSLVALNLPVAGVAAVTTPEETQRMRTVKDYLDRCRLRSDAPDIGADALRCPAEEVGDTGKHLAVSGADLPGGDNLETETIANQGGVMEGTDWLGIVGSIRGEYRRLVFG